MHSHLNPKLIIGSLCCAIACALSSQAAAPAPILFDSPRGGEIFFNGQQQAVRLNAKTKAKSVLIELSRDGGQTYVVLGTIDNKAKDKTLRNVLKFTVDGASSNVCIFRATAGTSTGLSGQFAISNGGVTIQPGSIGKLELADGSVTNPKLAPLAVSNDKVTSGTASTGMVLAADGLGGATWNSVPPPAGFTGNLSGDVTGPQNATVVAAVGGLSAASVASGATAANAATTANTPNTIVKRDANGAIPGATVGQVTLTGDVTGPSNANTIANVGGITAAEVAVGASAANAATTANTPNTIIKRDANGIVPGSVTLGGNVTGSSGANVVATVGGVSAANVASGANLANAATTAATPNTLVKRDASGNFAGNAANVTGIVPIANGGTGSATQNFVDLKTDQTTIGGNKTLTDTLAVSTAFVIQPRPANTGLRNFFAADSAGAANTSGSFNTYVGTSAGEATTIGSDNTFVGDSAGRANTIGGSNTFLGDSAGRLNTSGINNTFVGGNAGMSSNGSNNIAIGRQAGNALTTGSGNIDIGNVGVAGESNTTRIGTAQTAAFIAGISGATSTGGTAVFVNASGKLGTLTGSNIFAGEGAGAANTTGTSNTYFGHLAGNANASGNGNTCVGDMAGANNMTFNATFIGNFAGTNNTTGTGNTYVGSAAGSGNTTSNDNTCMGISAGSFNTGASNTFLGSMAGSINSTGSSNTCVGANAGFNLTTGSNNIDISNGGVFGEANTIRIGTSGTQTRTFIAGISGVTVSGGTAVSILANGQLGTITSSRRFKENIKPMAASSETLLRLKPVTFTYKKDLDPNSIPQWGLIAEEVADINPDLIIRDESGAIRTVRYEQINAMLLNEFLKEHKKVEDQQKQILALAARLAKLEAKH